jgi:putative lipoic acid-binding regulatory protein
MSFFEKNPFEQNRAPQQAQQVTYPAEMHFRVITEPAVLSLPELEAVLSRYKVTQELEPSHQSEFKRYLAYSVSIAVQSREQMAEIDAALRAVPGVRMVL